MVAKVGVYRPSVRRPSHWIAVTGAKKSHRVVDQRNYPDPLLRRSVPIHCDALAIGRIPWGEYVAKVALQQGLFLACFRIKDIKILVPLLQVNDVAVGRPCDLRAVLFLQLRLNKLPPVSAIDIDNRNLERSTLIGAKRNS